MQGGNYSFLRMYKALNHHKIDDKHKEATFLRNKLVLEHYEAAETLDNENACSLLQRNLEKYSEFMVKNVDMYKERIKKELPPNTPNCKQWKCSLTAKNAQQVQEHMPKQCNEDFENMSDEVWKEFGSLFLKATPPESVKFQNKKRRFEATSSDSNINYSSVSSSENKAMSFRTAKDELQVQNARKFGVQNPPANRKTLGMRRANNKFVSPVLAQSKEEPKAVQETVEDERLKNIEPRMIELIKGEIMDIGAKVTWADVAGLEFAKSVIQEAVVWPLLRPDIFTGLRRPPKGILLFGPPGTGKTLIGKCVASQSKSTFFSISASSLTSKWIGDGEKMVRALFAVARCHQPAVIFMDEIDSLLCQRSENEHECSRRLKTEFLVQLDGAATDNDERILLIGATNRPQELDEAARRRFVKRLYIPLPEHDARLQLIDHLMQQQNNTLTVDNKGEIARLSDGYSGADIKTLCSEASLGPIRSIDLSQIETIQANEVRPVCMEDFQSAFARVRSSVAPKDLEQYIIWNNTYGSGS